MPDAFILNEKEIKIGILSEDILSLIPKLPPDTENELPKKVKRKTPPPPLAIMDFDKNGLIKGDWVFKFSKAFEAAFNIRNGVGANKHLRYQNDNFTLNKGDTFETMPYGTSSAEFLSDLNNRSIEVHFSNGKIIRFWLFKPSKDGKRYEKVGMYRCTNLEFLQILKYGIDQYL